jgi:predicted metalloprotease
MALRRSPALIAVAAIVLAACGTGSDVTAERAERIVFDPTNAEQPDAGAIGGGIDDPAQEQEPPTTTTVPSAPSNAPTDPGAIDFGPDKPPKPYDDFLLAVMTDIEVWWTEQYPAIYGEEYRPLEGEVYAAYPGRPDDIPGCGTPTTSYEDVRLYVAFYCGVGDFLVYDDSDDGLLAELAREYGSGTIGTVLAHEMGHAIQLRTGALDRNYPTILTEQQADCFAGAWTARAAGGRTTTVTYTDADVRAGLIAMTKVSDPVGIDQFLDGGHGSGFDRVGAFQVGFTEGPARCAEILDAPLPLVPNRFTSLDEQNNGGNAPFGYGEDDLLGFLPEDLNLYWSVELGIADIEPLRLRVVESGAGPACSDLRGDFSRGAALCASSDEVVINEPAALDLYRSLGDFSVGYLLGLAWSEAVQDALGSRLAGEERALLSDCLTGGWVQTVILVDTGAGVDLPRPRADGRTATVSAGDLDEAIQTVLMVSDLTADDDVIGNAFEKIAALRTGVIDGTDACLAQL